MSSQSALLYACQWGSGHKGEMVAGDSNSVTLVNFSVGAPPGTLPVGVGFGNYALTNTLVNATGSGLSVSLGNGQYTNLGFWARPTVNCTLGNQMILALDDGAGNGLSVTHQSADKKMGLYSCILNTQIAAGTVVVDALATYQTQLNPWWYFTLTYDARSGGTWFLNCYEWDTTNVRLNKIGATLTATASKGNQIYLRTGQTGNRATGTWAIANVSVWSGGQGLFGPLGCSMVTIVPTGKTINNVNWKKGDTGLDDPTLGPTDTEWPYITPALPPADTPANTNYLKIAAAANNSQRYTMTQGSVTGQNVLGVCGKARFWDNQVGGSDLFEVGLISGAGSSLLSEFLVSPATPSVWFYGRFVTTSWIPGTNTPFAPADIDALLIHHHATCHSTGEVRCSQAFCTVVYGNDEAALAALYGESQVI